MISIIVPIYKVEPYLRHCLESIIYQTYKDIEILLIDDGSPDNCGNICEEYALKDKRIRVFHTENRGLSAARNLGIKESRGEFIGFVDSDDWIELDMYETLLNKAIEYSADICECNFWFGTNITKYIDLDEAVYRGTDSLEALFNNKICHVAWNKIYKKELFETVSFPEGRNIEDISIMHLIIDQATTVVVMDDKKYHYRQRTDSIKHIYSASNLLDYADAFFDRYKFYKRNRKKLPTVKEEKQLLEVAVGISRVWRWWYGCNKIDRLKYTKRIYELKCFTKSHFPLFGYSTWPVFLRCSSLFMHSDSTLSFIIIYYLNQLYRKTKPEKSNVVK